MADKKQTEPHRRPLQLESDLWDLLWQECRKSATPITPQELARDILRKHLSRKKK